MAVTAVLVLCEQSGLADIRAWVSYMGAAWCGEVADAEKALDRVHAYGFATVSSAKLIRRAFSIAIKFDRTVYDSLYVALATEYGIQLVTADEKLVKAVESRCPVRWLGSL